MKKSVALIELRAYEKMLSIEEFCNNKIQLITSAGVFYGNLKPDTKNIGQRIISAKNEAISTIVNEHSSDKIDMSDLFVTLYDATLFQGGNQVRFNAVDILIDSIIGISIGQI